MNITTDTCHLEFHAESERPLIVRLDKWLWAARFFKTRVLARRAVELNLIELNQVFTQNPSCELQIGDQITLYRMDIDTQRRIKIQMIQVTGLSTRRRKTEAGEPLYQAVFLPEKQASNKNAPNKNAYSKVRHYYARPNRNSAAQQSSDYH